LAFFIFKFIIGFAKGGMLMCTGIDSFRGLNIENGGVKK